MPCISENRTVVRAFDADEKTFYLFMTRCKSWYCPYCGHVNKLQWIAKVSHGIDYYREHGIDEWMFCTVTSHPKLKTRDNCLWVEPKAWKKLWSRVRYHHGKVRYTYIPELHKNGRVHWHMLMSGGIEKSWWKKHAPSCGFGYMFDSQPVRDGENSVLYVTKELGKSLAISTWPRKLRRIRTSQKWPLLPPGEEFDALDLQWHYMTSTSEEKLEDLRSQTEELSGIKTVVLGVET